MQLGREIREPAGDSPKTAIRRSRSEWQHPAQPNHHWRMLIRDPFDAAEQLLPSAIA
jgi:hypothetical protein